jgi:membrane-anchored glycerophosphoryl diester phosphodiesterase (GDPDase)
VYDNTKGDKEMRTETAQRVLWFAMVFIVLGIIATVVAGFGVLLAFALIDLGSFITDPTVLAFIESYPLVIPIVIWILAGLQIIYLGIIYMWRKDPMRHRTGLTIVGILNLLIGFSLPGLFIILPGLLLEE